MIQVAILHLELFIPHSQSLKDKRSVLQRVLHRIRNQHAFAVAEVDHQDLWQRATLAVAAVSASKLPIEQAFQKLLRDLDEISEDFEVAQSQIEWR
jgi:uncharacterized protein YlxP (DUF503 family)